MEAAPFVRTHSFFIAAWLQKSLLLH